MKTHVSAPVLLNGLLDRIERQPERAKRVFAHPAQSFADGREREDLAAALRAAEDAGAIAIEWDRDAPHLIRRVCLKDAGRLYAHLRRTPSMETAKAAAGRMAGIMAASPEGAALAHAMAEAWRQGGACLGCGPADFEDAARLVRCMDAALAPGTLPLRTRSTRLLGDSKALERALPRLLIFLRRIGRIAAESSDEDATAELALRKFPWPILMAGPLLLGGADTTDWPYIGIPSEMITRLDLAAPPASLLTIENLESFNRHVREARRPDDLVIYTGGFPSSSVVGALRHLIARGRIRHLFHWGDIDPGGLQIGAFVESVISCAVQPHLMTEELALAHGRPATSKPERPLPSRSNFAVLAAFLSSPNAHVLEQEAIDPAPVDVPDDLTDRHGCEPGPAAMMQR